MNQPKRMAEKMTDDQIERMLGHFRTNSNNKPKIAEFLQNRDLFIDLAGKWEEAYFKAVEIVEKTPSIYKNPQIPQGHQRVAYIGK